MFIIHIVTEYDDKYEGKIQYIVLFINHIHIYVQTFSPMLGK